MKEKPWRPYRVPHCSGFGDVHTRLGHGMTCIEVACDLRYVAADYDWSRVVRSYKRRKESLDGRERADIHNRRVYERERTRLRRRRRTG